jgi:hypothetical protein
MGFALGDLPGEYPQDTWTYPVEPNSIYNIYFLCIYLDAFMNLFIRFDKSFTYLFDYQMYYQNL